MARTKLRDFFMLFLAVVAAATAAAAAAVVDVSADAATSGIQK